MSGHHRFASLTSSVFVPGLLAVALASSTARAEESPLGPLTARTVGERAVDSSFDARASQEALRAAAARVDQAWAGFLPRLSGVARYTRDSNFTPLAIPGLVGTTAPTGTANPGPTESIAISFPTVVDNYTLQGSIAVPISDYLFRIHPTYEAAKASEAAASHDFNATRARVYSDGEIAFFTWLRARAAVGVAELALQDQEHHRTDAQHQFDAGNASKADVLRANTNVASAQYALEQARSLVEVTETQLRTALHTPDETTLNVATTLEEPLPRIDGHVAEWTREGIAQREEMKSLTDARGAARKRVTVATAGSWPVISAFADALDANPNPRRFPQTDAWFATWDIGVQATWSPNNLLVAHGARQEAKANVAQLEAQIARYEDAIRIEVRQGWEAVREADVGIVTAGRELESATEAYAVARDLFDNGRGTSTTLTDAETELTRARLDLVNARADARIARVRLDHATGRDVALLR